MKDQPEDERVKEPETEETEKETKDAKTTKKGSERYVFECQRCGMCCEKKDSVVVSIADLERWSKDVTLPSLYPFLGIETKDDYIQISLKKPDEEEGKVGKGCPLYDKENKLCNIYFSMPLYCRSFPLGYDGDKYFLKDKNCPGIGKGAMTQEMLREAREAAKEDFEARVSTALLLPVIHGLTLKFLLEESKKQMDQLTDEQKEKLRDIMKEEKSTDFYNDEINKD